MTYQPAVHSSPLLVHLLSHLLLSSSRVLKTGGGLERCLLDQQGLLTGAGTAEQRRLRNLVLWGSVHSFNPKPLSQHGSPGGDDGTSGGLAVERKKFAF